MLQCALPNQPCTKNLWTVQWPLALDGHRNGIKFRDIHYGQISSFCFLCFVFSCFLYFLERIHDTEHYIPMFLITNYIPTYLCQNCCQICFLCKKWKLTWRHCVLKCRFRLKKNKSIVKDNRDVFFEPKNAQRFFDGEKKELQPRSSMMLPFL